MATMFDLDNLQNQSLLNIPNDTGFAVRPDYSKAGSNMARLSGFDLKSEAELNAMNQAEVDKYSENRLAARNKGIGELLYMFSDALKGKDIQQGAQARQQNRMLMQQDQERIARQQQLNNLIPALDFNDSQKALLGTFPPSVQAQTIADLMFKNNNEIDPLRFGVYDTDGNQVDSVLRKDFSEIEAFEDAGFIIGDLGKPTTLKGKGSVKDITTPLSDQYKATGKIINATNSLAQKLQDNPNSALAVGTLAQFTDSIIQNIDGGLNMLGKKEDTNAYKSALIGKGDSQDFNERIKQTSIDTGVKESRIRDLAYLFAAARGQTGRGLSDKDYENALRIVSGGVGVDGKLAVLEDVSNRLRGEALYEIEFNREFYKNNSKVIESLNNLPNLPNFVNPRTQVQPQSGQRTVDDILNDNRY